MTEPVTVVIPWRDRGDPTRQANLARVLDHLSETGWPLILADDGGVGDEPFNRQRAYNWGRTNFPSDVYVWHEADMLVPLDQLADAVALADRRLGVVIPFLQYRYHEQEASRLMLSGTDPATLTPAWTMEDGKSIGAVNVTSEATMRAVGQWDERLSGHGFDDNAMVEAFRTACGQVAYVDGPADHLWHPPAYSPWARGTAAANPRNYSGADMAATYRNKSRHRLYLAAKTPERVRELTAGGD